MTTKTVSLIVLTDLLVSVLLLSASHTYCSISDVQKQWSKTYGGANLDLIYSIIRTSDGGYALVGYTASYGAIGHDFWLVKVDSDGNMEWSKTYGGASVDWGYSVCQTRDGGYALVGYTYSFGVGRADFWLVKVDSDGNMEWSKTYGGTSDDSAKSIIQTNDGGYVIAGDTHSYGSGNRDFWLVKVDSDGNMEWSKTYGGTNNELGPFLIQTSNGDYVMVGATGSFGAGNGDAWLVKVDSAGRMLWNKTYGGKEADYPYSMIQTSDGGYALACDTYSYGSGNRDFWLVKVDSDGNMEWSKTYGGTEFDGIDSIIQTTDYGYLLLGSTTSFGAGNSDLWLVKVDSDGNMEWSKTYGGTNNDWGHSLVDTNDGGCAIAGATASYGSGHIDAWLIKIAEIIDPNVRARTISLEEFYYTDSLPNSLDQFLEALSFKDIAVLGDFHALLHPSQLVQNAEVEIVVDYVTVGQRSVNQETKYYTLTPKGSEWVGNIRIETVWPFAPVDWLRALAMAAYFRDPSFLIEKIGMEVYLPNILTYIGFERIYTAAKVTRIVGKDVTGKSFEIVLETALPLKTSYQKMADWAKGEGSLFVTTMCPVMLSVVDNLGNRVGAKDNTLYEQIDNAYYIGEVGKVQLVLIENPTGKYTIEVEGTYSGNYTLIAGRNVAGKRETIVLANAVPTEEGLKDLYQVSTVPSESISIIDDDQDSLDYVPYIILAVAIMVAGIVIGWGMSKRKEVIE